ncbi:DNA-binding MarR family transcriptional regulator [Novosphingobium hassiacum]|uniref:DNA-binding MarR family transcriptional regulator n=1 Tax=Novosphingobium hassiacum TaxID=173676 RepID=A0A7W5ZXB3_9SPHN|nr:helix-turn-helix domain-containing protein [Novosphingobium hassiacum]MBB3860964.1 DNA-binding MarR family transcriptional regulator [Novosphingobium hassiacum]
MSELAVSFVRFLDEFARLRGRIQSAFQPVEGQSQLSELETVVLNAVTGATSPPTVPQIGRSLGHARQVIQRAANSLAERGLIEPVSNPDHKRAHRLVATVAGIDLKAELDLAGLSRAAELTAGLDAQTLGQATYALHVIRETLEANLRREEHR